MADIYVCIHLKKWDKVSLWSPGWPSSVLPSLGWPRFSYLYSVKSHCAEESGTLKAYAFVYIYFAVLFSLWLLSGRSSKQGTSAETLTLCLAQILSRSPIWCHIGSWQVSKSCSVPETSCQPCELRSACELLKLRLKQQSPGMVFTFPEDWSCLG